MPTAAGPNSNEQGLVFAIDMADVTGYKGQPATNIWESGHPNPHGSALRIINTDKWLGKRIDSGVVYHNMVNRRATADSPDKTFFNNGGLNIGSMQFSVLRSDTRYIQISFDYYGVTAYKRFCCPSSGLNGYLGVEYSDGSRKTSGWDTTYSPGNGDDWNNLDENMGKWQRISLIATLDQNLTPQSIWALYIYYDALMQGEGYFANMIFTEHSSYPTGPVKFVNGSRNNSESLFNLFNKTSLDVSTTSFNSFGSIVFDGTSDYLTGPFLSDLVGENPSAITFEVVFKPDVLTDYSGVIGDYVGPSGTGFAIKRRSPTDDRIEFRVYAVNSIPAMDAYFISGETVHVVCTWDNSGRINMYHNGVIKTQISGVGTTWNHGNAALRIGHIYGGMGNPAYFSGEIPVVKIYNKALTAEDIANNYNTLKKRFNI